MLGYDVSDMRGPGVHTGGGGEGWMTKCSYKRNKQNKGSVEHWTRVLMSPGELTHRLKPRYQLNNLVKG